MLGSVPPPDGVAHWPLGTGISNVEIHAACDVPKIPKSPNPKRRS
jgi:hypothetical protein